MKNRESSWFRAGRGVPKNVTNELQSKIGVGVNQMKSEKDRRACAKTYSERAHGRLKELHRVTGA